MQVFFYGLFMDVDILAKNGIKPSNLTRGYLKDYVLKIGDRASLVPCMNEISYGLVMTVEDEAIQKLYSNPSVADYIPEDVNITTETNDSIVATCYNLPLEYIRGNNTSYAASLLKLGEKLNFPADYLKKIERYSHTAADK